MKNVKIRRFTAYCIDLLLITFIIYGLYQIKVFHPNAKKYEDATLEYIEYADKILALEDDTIEEPGTVIVYFSNELTEEEINNLNEELNKIDDVDREKLVTREDTNEDTEDKVRLAIKEYFSNNEGVNAYIIGTDDASKVEDIIKDINKLEHISNVLEYIDQDENEEEKPKALSEMSANELKEYMNETGDKLQKIYYYGLSYNISWLVVTILYFTLFPYFNNGMTIGKRLFKLRYVRSDNESKKVSLWQYFVKALLCPIYGSASLTSALYFLILVIAPLCINGAAFAYTMTFGNFAIMILCYVDVFMMAFKKDTNGFTDKLAKVKVADYVRN